MHLVSSGLVSLLELNGAVRLEDDIEFCRRVLRDRKGRN